MQATFAKSAIVLFPNGEEPVTEGSVGAQAALLNPGTTFKAATYDHFTSGRHADLTWFSADLHITFREGSRTQKRTIRAIELLDGSADWKVVVAAFTNVGKLAETGSSPIANATPADVLTRLLVAPDALAAALAPEAVVLGTDPASAARATTPRSCWPRGRSSCSRSISRRRPARSTPRRAATPWPTSGSRPRRATRWP